MKNGVLISVIVLLMGVIGFEVYYVFNHPKEKKQENSYINIPKEQGDKEDDLPLENNQDEVEDYVKLVNVRDEESKVIQEYEMVLNGKKKEFMIEFVIDEVYINDGEREPNGDYWLIGAMEDEVVYSEILSQEEVKSNKIDKDSINNAFSERNFTIFEGNDKKYLIIADYGSEYFGRFMSYSIYNDDLKIIDSLSLYVGDSQSILNDLGFPCYDSIYADIYDLDITSYSFRTKIEGSKIYNLYYNYDQEPILEERVYTINNDKLTYEVVNTYRNLSIAGAV